MRRLEETLRQMCQAAKAIGNTELENKFSECKELILIFYRLKLKNDSKSPILVSNVIIDSN